MQYVRKRKYFRESNIIIKNGNRSIAWLSLNLIANFLITLHHPNLSSYSYTRGESFESVLPQFISYSPVLGRVPTDPVDPSSGLHLGSEMIEKAIRNCDPHQNVPWQKGNLVKSILPVSSWCWRPKGKLTTHFVLHIMLLHMPSNFIHSGTYSSTNIAQVDPLMQFIS
jgi:hypothetical protein